MSWSYTIVKNFGGGSGNATSTLIEVTPDTTATADLTISELAKANNVYLPYSPRFTLDADLSSDILVMQVDNVANVLSFKAWNSSGAEATITASSTFQLTILHD